MIIKINIFRGDLSDISAKTATVLTVGRVAGDDVVKDMQAELWASVKAGAGFEGEMAHIVGVLESLAIVLQTVRNTVQVRHHSILNHLQSVWLYQAV